METIADGVAINPCHKTVLVFPMYNEDTDRVLEGVRAVWCDLRKAQVECDIEFFILSDSNHPELWIREEIAWANLCRELGAFGKIFYRRRERNINKKSGNLADFCRNWGGRYTYMIVMDADSIMSGRAIETLVKLMERNPKAGIVQTAPRIVRSETVFGRLQQFALRFYGPLFMAGLDWWQGPVGNYWGHNAIIRLAPFTDYCDLPDLPGKEPFGGKILSHDFVEAALMVKAGWEVWLAWDVDETFEQAPQSVIEAAKRDRRWCQGNLQHTWLLFARGLHPASRVHLRLGIMAYVSAPVWLLFLMLSTWDQSFQKVSGLTTLTVAGYSGRYLGIDIAEHRAVIFIVTLVCLFMPKLLALVDSALVPGTASQFGGRFRLVASTVVETVFSTLLAPVYMLFYTKFIAFLILGKSVTWGPQKRDADGITWAEAFAAQWDQMALGVLWGCLAWRLDLYFFWWLSPILCGLCFAVALSVITSAAWFSRLLMRAGILRTVDEIRPAPVLSALEARLASLPEGSLVGDLPHGEYSGITMALLDPYVNAVHVSLLKPRPVEGREETDRIAERMLREGPRALSREEILRVLLDPDVTLELHRRIWTTPQAQSAVWWSDALTEYRIRAAA
jgi:membrane glycosyltransferase